MILKYEPVLGIMKFSGRVLKITTGSMHVKAVPVQFSALHICHIIVYYLKRLFKGIHIRYLDKG